MALLCAGAWAKNMTVRVVDHFGDPIAGLRVSISNPIWDEFTTDANGYFYINRSDEGRLYVDFPDHEAVQDFYLDWDGSEATTTLLKLEGFCMFTFRCPGMTTEQYDVMDLVVDGDITVHPQWDNNTGVALALLPFDTETNQLRWNLGDGFLGHEEQVAQDVSQPAARDITISLPDNLCLLEVGWTSPTGYYTSGRYIRIVDVHTQDTLGVVASTSQRPKDCYIPAGDYMAQVLPYTDLYASDRAKELPPPDRTFTVVSGQTNYLTYDYYNDAYEFLLTVLDAEGRPMSDVTVRHAENGSHFSDANGQVRYVGFPGKYTYKASRYVHNTNSYDQILVEKTDSVEIVDRDMEKTLSFEGEYFHMYLNLVPWPSFMTDPAGCTARMTIEENGFGRRETIEMTYDKGSGMFTCFVSKLPNGNCYREYIIIHPEMVTKSGTFEIERHDTIQVDLSAYRKVTFVPADPERHVLSDIAIYKAGEEDRGSIAYAGEGNSIHMEDGEYSVRATITDVATGDRYQGITPQPFTVAGQDVEVKYVLNEDDYNRLTITLIGYDGQGIADESIRVYNDTTGVSMYQNTDANGQAVFLLPNGVYGYSIYPDGYPQQSERISLYENKEIRISFEDYRMLTVAVSGDVVDDFLAVYDEDNWSASYTIYLQGEEDSQSLYLEPSADGTSLVSREAIYLAQGTYSYRLDFNSGTKMYFETEYDAGKFDLTDNYQLQIELSDEAYSQVALQVKSPDGQAITGGHLQVLPEGLMYSDMYYSLSAPSTIYLPDGNYTAVYSEGQIYGTGVESTVVSTQDFTVARAAQTVTITHEETELHTVHVRVKYPEKAADYVGYLYSLDFFMNGMLAYSTYLDFNMETLEGEADITLSAGTYTYEGGFSNMEKTGSFTVTSDGQELFIDHTQDGYLTIKGQGEDGTPATFMMMEIYQNGEYMGDDYGTGYFGVLPAGTYEVRAWAVGYNYLIQDIEVTGQDQTITLQLKKTDPNNFTVMFYVDYEQGSSLRDEVTLEGIGTSDGQSYVVFTDVPEGTYPYTVTADGYEPYTGTVVVNEENMVDVEYVGIPHVVMVEVTLQEPGPTQLPSIDGGSFRLFPTIADDVLHILPATAADGEWTMRITSSQGMAVYAARHALDAETVLPVGNLVPGLYLLTLDNGTEVNTYKFVKR